jgi:adenosylhomocysteine nucleosidase
MWQSLVRNWLHQQVRQKVYEHVASAGRSAAEAPDEPAPPPGPCDVGLVFALGIESGGLEDLLNAVVVTRGKSFLAREGSLQDRRLVLALAGVGRNKAERATRLLLAGHRPAWVISAGFSGALQPGLKRGDIVMADSLVEPGGGRLAIDMRIDQQSLASTPGLHIGRLLTVDKIVAESSEKQRLGQTYDALAVDMESWAVAEVCSQEHVRFLAVRVISDTLEENLPHDLGPLIAQQTTAGKVGALTGALWRRPSSFKDMLRLREQALIASDRLAKFLAGVIVQLVPRKDSP